MNSPEIQTIWVYLSASPLFGLCLTLITYLLAQQLFKMSGSFPLFNPVLVSVFIIITLMLVSGYDYQAYFEGGKFIHFLLGPATVALAIPLYNQLDKIREAWLPICVTIFLGVIASIASGLFLAKTFGASEVTQLSVAPKSVTTPVAMGISEQIGGLPSLTAVIVVLTGIIGVVIGGAIFRVIGIKDDRIKGVAMGVSAHGVGTARAFEISQEMGAFSGLAMAVSTIITALVIPFLILWLL